jgi:23S rRNA (cytosine1962-C5)-methyltransferase
LSIVPAIEARPGFDALLNNLFPPPKMVSWRMVPCVIFEDKHLLVVNKPAGWNTHAPSPYAGEGVYDWLKHRETRWSSLAILHRLDKETSGVLVFGKTPLANRSLTEQFTGRRIHKKYLLLTDRAVREDRFKVTSKISRNGEKYVNSASGEFAETEFAVIRRNRDHTWIEAMPLTGRTHQIRVHISGKGLPILGDTLYGGSPSVRVCLHAAELEFSHPATAEKMTLKAEVSFFEPASDAIRKAIIGPDTNCCRVRHGASDGTLRFYADRLGDWLLGQGELDLSDRDEAALLHNAARPHGIKGIYYKRLDRKPSGKSAAELSPQFFYGTPAPERFEILENGVRYEMSFNEGYSVGLFLDQRDNRRRFLTGHIAADFSLMPEGRVPRVPVQSDHNNSGTRGTRPSETDFEILNTFAYTCGFSVCAAKAGARTTSLDLSKKYLEWGKRNFALNGLDPAAHDFIYGDTFDWLRRLAKKGRAFDAIVLDPPTFSQSKEHGAFRAEKDYGKLVSAALPLVKPGGILFASTNAADWPPEEFLADVAAAVHAAERKILQRHYVPQPPDFPVSRAEPAYLKTVWLRIG